MHRPRVYIAAPINNMSFDLARSRNKYLSDEIESAGFEAVDPLKPVGDKLRGEHGGLDYKALEHGITSHDIVNGCLDKIGRSDAILVYLPGFKSANVTTWGTPMEMMFAYFNQKMVICVIDDYHSAWIDVFAKKAKNLNEAIEMLNSLKTNGVLKTSRN